ncbi:peptidoglycan-binding domain-containing protein [Virgibacillus oceani]|uniref:peptidoglycan-binding domain-containing protein n=1 Tax=Virgibacillus oceani TaxID=1479511 RepID=UPI001E53A1B2|nr:peptidoglycan-binding protein [Virgibacillus oceani]
MQRYYDNWNGKVVDRDEQVKSEEIVWYLSRGDHNRLVGDLQRKLKKLGYYDGKIDNNFGPKTESAVKAFQKHEGLIQDGSYGPKTQAVMKNAKSKKKNKIGPSVIPYPGYHFELRSPQMHDDNVGRIQRALNNAAGHKVVEVDNYYGPNTANEVGEYQERHDLEPDKMVGPITWSTLF